jgi:hypothetical protein
MMGAPSAARASWSVRKKRSDAPALFNIKVW